MLFASTSYPEDRRLRSAVTDEVYGSLHRKIRPQNAASCLSSTHLIMRSRQVELRISAGTYLPQNLYHFLFLGSVALRKSRCTMPGQPMQSPKGKSDTRMITCTQLRNQHDPFSLGSKPGRGIGILRCHFFRVADTIAYWRRKCGNTAARQHASAVVH